MSVAAGNAHSLFADFEGNVWGCGKNIKGCLGGLERYVPQASIIPFLSNICHVSSYHHSLFVDTTGNLYGCGDNGKNQLGVESEIVRDIKKIDGIPAISCSSAGYSHSLCLSKGGEVFGCGLNSYNQLGLPSNASGWAQIPELPSIQSLVAGFSHSLFLDVEGRVWTCGNNLNGSTGQGQSSGRTTKTPTLVDLEGAEIKKIAAGWNHSIFLDTEDRVWTVGSRIGPTQTLKPELLDLNIGAIDTISGGLHHVIVSGKEHIFGCGLNEHGSLPMDVSSYPNFIKESVPNFTNSTITEISSLFHSLFLTTKGEVWVCGTYSNPLGAEAVLEPTKLTDLPPIGKLHCSNTKSARAVI